MAKLVFDAVGSRFFETGVKNGVLFVQGADGEYENGVVWNGLTAVTESPSGAEATPLYADDMKYVVLYSTEEFGATIEAYTYPEEFEQCDGSAQLGAGITIGQQQRKSFGLVYKTVIGNDVQGQDLGYKIHIIYGAKAAPSEKAFSTINDSPEAVTFSWEVSTVPVPVEGHRPTSTLVIDSTKVDAEKLAAIEAKLFGSETEESTLPLPNEIAEMLK
ncbi:MAG: hypothetical protein J6J71_05430 [Prevotella sp.]|nr:hypothetical protein [Prevotella sp.]